MTPQEAADKRFTELQNLYESLGYRKDTDAEESYWKTAFISGQKWQSEQDNQALSSALKEIAELHAKIKELESKPNNFM